MEARLDEGEDSSNSLNHDDEAVQDVNLFAGTEHAKCAVRIPDESRPRTKMLE
jgi:hypothetical protein